jgi:type I restriction enzyme S subunit
VSNVDKHSHANELPVRLCNYTDVYKNERITLDMELMRATATPEEISKFHLQVDDVVITKDSETWNDIAVPALIAETEDDLVCGYHLAILRAESQVLSGRFLMRTVQSRPVALQLELASTGVTRCGLPKGAIGSAKIPLPEIATQHRVADYLDRETSQIDALVAEKERMLALLEDKRAALISRAVTRGLIPQAPTKPSGLDWLGDIPKHWEVMRSKGLFHEVDDRTTTGEEELLSLRMNVGLVPHHEVSGKELEPKDVVGFKKVMAGQLVINRMRASMGLIAISPSDGLVSPDYAVFDIVHPIHIPYFLALFNTGLVGALFRSSSKGIGTGSQGFLRLYTENFLSIHFPVPPIQEQKEIVETLDTEKEQTGILEAALRDSIALLKERRSALITAAVTGKIPMEEMSA